MTPEETLEELKRIFEKHSTVKIADMVHRLVRDTPLTLTKLGTILNVSKGQMTYYNSIGRDASPRLREAVDLCDMSAYDAYHALRWTPEQIETALEVADTRRRAYRRMLGLG